MRQRDLCHTELSRGLCEITLNPRPTSVGDTSSHPRRESRRNRVLGEDVGKQCFSESLLWQNETRTTSQPLLKVQSSTLTHIAEDVRLREKCRSKEGRVVEGLDSSATHL